MDEKHNWVGKPMDNQLRAARRAWPLNEFGLFHEMGTGKTYTAIHLCGFRYLEKQINAVIVFCPDALKLVWESEVQNWAPCPASVHSYRNLDKMNKFIEEKTCDGQTELLFFVFGIEAMSQGGAYESAKLLVRQFKCASIVDESDTIKNSQVNRTKRAYTIGAKSLYRLILTGTPITQGMEDLFGQFMFLNPDIIGCRRSFVLFKNRYCLTGGFEGRKIVGYCNEDELFRKVAKYIDIVKKTEVLDLPDKMYKTVPVELTREQLAAIRSLEEEYRACDDGHMIETTTVLERLTRYQQIIGGHFPFADEDGGYSTKPISGANPKIKALLALIEGLPDDTSVIIWARYTPEIDAILDALPNGTAVRFDGKVDDAGKRNAVEMFQAKKAKFFVSKPSVGGAGLTLTAATLVVYYSNSFSYRERAQSEDRAHRKGQRNTVTYVDIEATHKYDRMITQAITRKQDVARYVDSGISAEVAKHK